MWTDTVQEAARITFQHISFFYETFFFFFLLGERTDSEQTLWVFSTQIPLQGLRDSGVESSGEEVGKNVGLSQESSGI